MTNSSCWPRRFAPPGSARDGKARPCGAASRRPGAGAGERSLRPTSMLRFSTGVRRLRETTTPFQVTLEAWEGEGGKPESAAEYIAMLRENEPARPVESQTVRAGLLAFERRRSGVSAGPEKQADPFLLLPFVNGVGRNVGKQQMMLPAVPNRPLNPMKAVRDPLEHLARRLEMNITHRTTVLRHCRLDARRQASGDVPGPRPGGRGAFEDLDGLPRTGRAGPSFLILSAGQLTRNLLKSKGRPTHGRIRSSPLHG